MNSKPVVVGIDDKQPCAVRFAAESAAQSGVELRVVHCLEGPKDVVDWQDSTAYSLDAAPDPGHDLLDAAREVIDAMDSAPSTRYVLGAGSPHEILAEESSHASLVVVGTDSIKRMDRLFDGSVTAHLAKHAATPIAIVPEVSWPTASPGSSIVLALDARPLATGAIQFAFEEARRRDVELHVLHIAPVGLSAAETLALRGDIVRLLGDWPQRYPTVPVTSRLTHGAADEGCLRESASAGLLVLSRDRRRRHPVLTHIARHTHCPCVVVPGDWRDSDRTQEAS